MAVLLIDAGNTRLKWALSSSGCLAPVTRVRYPREGRLEYFLADQWGGIPAPSRVQAVSVASQHLTGSITAWIEKEWSVDVDWITAVPHACGVRNAYPDAAKLGADRWTAILAAWQLVGSPVCVFDCGTAITFDALDATGQHLGGLITAGITGMQHSLLKDTSGIVLQSDMGALTPFAHETSCGVVSGTHYAAVGFIDRMVKEVQKQLEMPIRTILTGGDAGALIPLLNLDFQHEPDLVIKGLNLIARGEL